MGAALICVIREVDRSESFKSGAKLVLGARESGVDLLAMDNRLDRCSAGGCISLGALDCAASSSMVRSDKMVVAPYRAIARRQSGGCTVLRKQPFKRGLCLTAAHHGVTGRG